VTAVLRSRNGTSMPLPVARWVDESAGDETLVLERAIAPVLDVGCGPARHVVALGRRGVVALGIDVSPRAVDLAQRRGAMVLRRSIFDRIPGATRWGSALLLDGNIGIGGDPGVLLRRIAGLLRPGGRVLAELAGPGIASAPMEVRVETDGARGPWFPWARVGIDDAGCIGAGAGLALEHEWSAGERWFVAWRR
jgi:SAM-dependent methyltransferase